MTLESFNKNEVLLQSLQNNKEEFLSLKAEDRDIEGFKNKLTDSVKEKFPNQIIEIKSNNTSCETYFYMSARFHSQSTYDNYLLATGYYSGFVELSKENKNLLNYKLIYGSYPKADNEIMITEYMFRSYQALGYSFEEVTKEIHSFEDLANIPFYIDNTAYKIVGILDTRFNYDYYVMLKNKEGNSTLYDEISILNDGIHTTIFVPENFFDAYSLSSISYTLNQNKSVSNQSIQIKKDLKEYEVICPTKLLGSCTISFENNFSKDINIIENCSENIIYVSEAFYHELEKELNINFSTHILLQLSKDMKNNLNKIQMLQEMNLRVENQYTIMLDSISETYTFIATLLKYISIFLLAFSIILAWKFSFDSIHDKRKEIAIYKSLGVGYRDISIMFYLQSIFIGLISTLIAIP
ncbi:MAG: ABC transporter permease, partial [Anaeroplasmataceae bacterium]|nr:ABC transporter permease [Anaeroplasmataceae bacterium]